MMDKRRARKTALDVAIGLVEDKARAEPTIEWRALYTTSDLEKLRQELMAIGNRLRQEYNSEIFKVKTISHEEENMRLRSALKTVADMAAMMIDSSEGAIKAIGQHKRIRAAHPTHDGQIALHRLMKRMWQTIREEAKAALSGEEAD